MSSWIKLALAIVTLHKYSWHAAKFNFRQYITDIMLYKYSKLTYTYYIQVKI